MMLYVLYVDVDCFRFDDIQLRLDLNYFRLKLLFFQQGGAIVTIPFLSCYQRTHVAFSSRTHIVDSAQY